MDNFRPLTRKKDIIRLFLHSSHQTGSYKKSKSSLQCSIKCHFGKSALLFMIATGMITNRAHKVSDKFHVSHLTFDVSRLNSPSASASGQAFLQACFLFVVVVER